MSHDEYKRRLAESFDNRLDYNKENFHGRLAERVVTLACPNPGEKVLDIATGTGLAAIEAARRVGTDGCVIGVDFSEGMLSRAAVEIERAELTNIELAYGDAEHLSFPAEQFDIVLCVSALPYMTDILGALRSWRGLLTPGGRLAFNCWSEASYITGHILRVVAAKHGIQMPITGEETGTPNRCRELLSNAGFVEPQVVVEAQGRFVTLEQVDKAWDVWIKNPVFHPRNHGDASRLAELRDEYRAEAASRATPVGVWDEMTAYFVRGLKPLN
jgi:ubiquinone/menaquinone biosynthesis C-methylase UbiE